MKFKIISIVLMSGVLMFSCSDNSGGGSGSPVDVSGKVQGGYRHLPISMKSDSTKLVVYRGDYVKFYIDDQGKAQIEYPLDIAELGVSVVLKDNTLDQPFFKMKITGSYQFTIGDKVGEIEVVELRQSNYRELGAEEAWKIVMKNPPLLLDVRTANEFSRGYIKGAILIPLQDLQARAGELEQYQNQPILIYCATGNRSTTASKILLDKGYKDVMNLRMGIMGWASKGYNIQFQ
ncbi:MAG: rhodanese-like domain-containing protein [Candidatus Marinimicrobia bacterium]|jgi:rhodanese-related sulfurtransferase|nr:rhodanese-like domain-containing protein [Candidatus Neomarinimicrobiota bacterium]MBT3575096.1 rhodanese-like domain-containing protein [Candidatus Neomarinimicrobiota bacterium]MBT3678868.1 rhodanese-like domain-containing protein [Candidatus Neomarinimicrobiota bacterium]MBT3949982.1 rhodanese-like domain-containing protein [Candidatus Neomarinimicrobiota bacterium]MBT4252685.1 rhodanese-like domain-containing protein [Candidatus Neomarinimicrobiota bacterium]